LETTVVWLCGVFVHANESKEAYAEVLSDIYLNTLRWAYEPAVALPERVGAGRSLDCIMFNKAPVDLRSFVGTLWKDKNNADANPSPGSNSSTCLYLLNGIKEAQRNQ
jgi:hypothetical protein